MKTKTFIVILLLLGLAQDALNFGRKRSAKCRKDPEEITNADNENSTADYYYDCDPTEFGIVQKIPYIRSSSTCDTVNIDFSSACVKCGMCLAIADKINDTFLEAYDIISHNDKNDTEIELFLRTICDQCFQYHNLYEVKGKRFISDKIPNSILVSTSADGLWPRKLKELCHYYLDEIGETQLYEQWLKWYEDDKKFPDITNIMCRSADGILRDCRSIDNMEKYDPPIQTFNAKVKISAWFDRYAKNQ